MMRKSMIQNGTLQDSNTYHKTLVITELSSVRKTPEPPIRPPIVLR